MSIYTKLNQARNQFHKLQLKKSGLNKFAGYQYFELADFLIPAMEIMAKNDLCAFISFGKELATMKIVDATDSTEIEITSPMSTAALKGCHEVQQLGAVQSYLRRYLWVAALEIVEHDALDSSAPVEMKTDGKVVRAVYKEAVKQPALGGVGDDLPQDDKTWLQEVALYITGLVTAGKADVALAKLQGEYNLDDTQNLFMQRHLDSKTRTALRNADKQPATA